MKFVDLEDPHRVDRPPDSIVLISSNDFNQNEFLIKKIELREYVEKVDKVGSYSLITSLVETDKGTMEMKYEEGYHSKNSLQSVKDFLVQNLGISGLILRSIIALREEIKKQQT